MLTFLEAARKVGGGDVIEKSAHQILKISNDESDAAVAGSARAEAVRMIESTIPLDEELLRQLAAAHLSAPTLAMAHQIMDVGDAAVSDDHNPDKLYAAVQVLEDAVDAYLA